ncbi:MAG TPA: hypothetical protein VFB62_03700 [Polyangiaceae bacterium]|nr:hypothetical protein [Polyangiaceae bacterium]
MTRLPSRLVALVVSVALFVASLCAGDSYAFCHVLESVADDCCGKTPAAPAIERGCCETRQFGSLPPAEPRAAPIGLALPAGWTIARVEPVAVHRIAVAQLPFRSVPLARGAPERLAHLMRFLN